MLGIALSSTMLSACSSDPSVKIAENEVAVSKIKQKALPQRAAANMAALQDLVSTTRHVSDQSSVSNGANNSLSITRLPGQGDDPNQGVGAFRSMLQELEYSTAPGSVDRRNVEAALAKLNSLEAQKKTGLKYPGTALQK